VSIIKHDDDSLGLRVDKILSIKQQVVNLHTMPPVEGAVTPLVARDIIKQKKLSEEKMNMLTGNVRSSGRKLPWLSRDRNPLHVYRHFPLGAMQQKYLGWMEAVPPTPKPILPLDHLAPADRLRRFTPANALWRTPLVSSPSPQNHDRNWGLR
jgi:hypothetical protein